MIYLMQVYDSAGPTQVSNTFNVTYRYITELGIIKVTWGCLG